MHRITRRLNKEAQWTGQGLYSQVDEFADKYKDLVHEAITSALLEEQED